MRDIVLQLATEHLTDKEIDAVLVTNGHGPMTPEEIHQATEARLAGRGEVRLGVADLVKDSPQIEKAKALLDKVLDKIKEKVENSEYSGSELVRVGKFLSSMSIVPRAAALQGRLALAHQYAGFTRNGYDADLRTEAEKADTLAAAERAEARRQAIENAN